MMLRTPNMVRALALLWAAKCLFLPPSNFERFPAYAPFVNAHLSELNLAWLCLIGGGLAFVGTWLPGWWGCGARLLGSVWGVAFWGALMLAFASVDTDLLGLAGLAALSFYSARHLWIGDRP